MLPPHPPRPLQLRLRSRSPLKKVVARLRSSLKKAVAAVAAVAVLQPHLWAESCRQRAAPRSRLSRVRYLWPAVSWPAGSFGRSPDTALLGRAPTGPAFSRVRRWPAKAGAWRLVGAAHAHSVSARRGSQRLLRGVHAATTVRAKRVSSPRAPEMRPSLASRRGTRRSLP